ncbi:hypothetical protein [Frigoribacterium sp. Leaf186]|uniref:hypothetical protein n=1 Tax=Frigoribacterium sp. Leaf186 TaxID=1736293 RepID=UPI000B087D9B|nr:hypothetical protein [Frigoribacterium sp. Leaf186]
MSRYELQWMVVLNCIVIACFACVYAVDVDGSVFWGLFVVVLMIGQIVQATRPERPSKEAQPGPVDVSRRHE